MPYPLLLHSRHHPNAEYESIGEWLVPWHINGFAEDYKTLKNEAGLIDVSTQAIIEISGNDRIDFLQRITSQDVRELKPGQGTQAALLTANGKIISTLIVLAHAESVWLLCEAPLAHNITQTLEKYHFSEDLTITNQERSHAVFVLKGPRAEVFIKNDVAQMEPLAHRTVTLNPLQFHLMQGPALTQNEYWCIIPSLDAPQAWDFFQKLGLKPIGWQAYNAVRIEEGVRWMGIDITEENLIPETGLSPWLISEDKGCYVGQEVVTRMLSYGSANKRCMGLILEGSDIPQSGTSIWSDDQEIGRITSSAYSLDKKQVLAIGYIKRGFYEAGKSVQVATDNSSTRAVLSELPF